MKKLGIVLLVLLLSACSSHTQTKKKTETKKPEVSSYCKEEESSSCGIDEGSADMSAYENFKDKDNYFIEANMKEALAVFEKKESAILYFGYPKCPWCIEALPIMNAIAKQQDHHILYIPTRDAKKKLLYTQKQKQTLLPFVKAYMEKDDKGEYQLFVPFVVVVKDGKAISGHIGTVDGHDAHERKMTKQEQQELTDIYTKMFAKLKEEE